VSRKVAETSSPEGITVVLSESRLAHIVAGHENLAGHVDEILATVQEPSLRFDDVRPGRERFYGLEKGPQRWLVVVVEFTSTPAFIVTAFADDADPLT
jgi:hypothetical protein